MPSPAAGMTTVVTEAGLPADRGLVERGAPISPELVLVGADDYRKAAIAALPEREAFEFLAFAPGSGSRRHPELDNLAFLGDDDGGDQAARPRAPSLVLTAAAYGALSLLQLLLVWSLLMLLAVVAAFVIIWAA